MPNNYIDHLQVNGVSYSLFSTLLANNIASEYPSSSAQFKPIAVGDLYMYKEKLYKCKTAISNYEVWTSSHWKVVAINDELANLESALLFDEYFINNGQYTILASDLESGQWSYSTKTINDTRARTKNLIPIRSGTKITYSNTTFDIYLGVLETPTSNTYIQASGWTTNESGEYNVTKDGYLTFIIRNHADTSVVVDPEDYNSTVTITTKAKNEIEKAKDEISDIKTIINGDGVSILRHGSIDSSTGLFYPINTRVLMDFKSYGKVLKLTVKPGYRLWIYKTGDFIRSQYITNDSESDKIQFFYAYSSKQWAFIICKVGDDVISFEEALANVTIEEAQHKVEEIVQGIKKESVEFAPDTLFQNLNYTLFSDRASSAPIKIPKGGLRIANNPQLFRETHENLVPFRVVCVKMTANGFELISQFDNEDLYAESNTRNSTILPVYIPYIEDTYVIINTGTYIDSAGINDAIWVYSGESKEKGKVLGLHPVAAYVMNDSSETALSQYKVIINFGSHRTIIATSNYYGGYLWLRYVKSISVDPKYTILANIYKLNDDGTIEKINDYYSYCPDTSNGLYPCGVQYIDLSMYDFDGFVEFAIESSVQYRASGQELNSYKYRTGMGIMNRYMDVFNSVHVEYKNGYLVEYEKGLPSIIFDNVNDFMNYTYPKRFGSYYINPHDSTNNVPYQFLSNENVSPAFYDGYNGNTIFLNVTGKSYYTAMANPNSRCYNFRWSGATGNVANVPIGYGITCTDYTSILLGLKENYWISQFAFGENSKFTKIKENWDARTEMDLLKPGDVLTQCYKESDTTMEGHCMIVYEKKYINGQLEAITIVEAGYPYTRFTTLYNEKYYPLLGNWITFNRLYGYEDVPGNPATYHGGYKWINRIKPQYLKRIKDVYDLSRSYTPGKIMCDRGTDSIYSVFPVDGAYPDGEQELAAYSLPISISDNEASNVYIYKTVGATTSLVGTVSIGDTRVNNLRVVDIKQYIKSGGVYTLKLSQSGDVQERFYVQESFEFETDDPQAPEGYKRIHIPKLSQLQYMEVNYRSKTVVNGENKFITTWRNVYTKEQFSMDTSSYAQDNTWGVIDVPNEITIPAEFTPEEKATYTFTILVYGTDYGTFQLRTLNRNGTSCFCAISGYSQWG